MIKCEEKAHFRNHVLGDVVIYYAKSLENALLIWYNTKKIMLKNTIYGGKIICQSLK